MQEAQHNKEIEARDLQTLTVLSTEVAARRRSISPSSGNARPGVAAADRLRELGAAFEAVLAATGGRPHCGRPAHGHQPPTLRRWGRC